MANIKTGLSGLPNVDYASLQLAAQPMVTQARSEMQREVDAAANRADRNYDAYERERIRADQNYNAYEAERKAYNQLVREYNAMKDGLTNDYNGLVKKHNELIDEYRNFGTAYDELNGENKRLWADYNQLQASSASMEARLNAVNAELAAFRKKDEGSVAKYNTLVDEFNEILRLGKKLEIENKDLKARLSQSADFPEKLRADALALNEERNGLKRAVLEMGAYAVAIAEALNAAAPEVKAGVLESALRHFRKNPETQEAEDPLRADSDLSRYCPSLANKLRGWEKQIAGAQGRTPRTMGKRNPGSRKQAESLMGEAPEPTEAAMMSAGDLPEEAALAETDKP